MSEKTQGPMTDAKVSELDKALAKVKARKANKDGNTTSTTTTASGEKPAKAPKPAKEPSAPKRPRLTEEQKAEREAAKAKERAEKKAAREAARAAKKAEREQAKQPAHMRKVQKAAEKLGPIGNEALQLMFNEITANYTAAQVTQLAAHLNHFNRVKATERALNQKIEAGQQVRIVGGDHPQYIGKTGTVTKAQRIRCYVEVEGAKKPVYLFTSNVEPITAANESAAAAG